MNRPLLRAHAKVLAFLLFAALLFKSFAHDVGLSSAEVRLQQESVSAEIVFAGQDIENLFELDTNKDGSVTQQEFAAVDVDLNRYFAAACTLVLDSEKTAPASVRSSIDETNNVTVAMEFPAHTAKELIFQFDVVADMPPGHRLFVSVVGSNGEPIAQRLLDRDAPYIHVPLAAAGEASGNSRLPSFLGFVVLGLEHIVTGYDHLLFLFALLLVARTFRSSVLIITCFTLAHSITLAVATYNLVTLRPHITEPLIAATILYVGLENILRKGDPHGRWLLTFVFGLVHGFGFASILRDMGVASHSGGVALPLLGFNLGVELGQILVAAIIVPIIWKLRTQPVFVRRAIPWCSACVAALGAYWLFERLLS
jgi:hydrogenase/urease accessory protein HupE